MAGKWRAQAQQRAANSASTWSADPFGQLEQLTV
jgi:hypothetical protein